MDLIRECRDDGGNFVSRCRSLVDGLIHVLDMIDLDPDLEPSLGWPNFQQAVCGGNDDLDEDDRDDEAGGGPDDREQDSDEEDGADDEPSLGSHEIRPAGAVSYACKPILTYDGTYYDGEEEHDGREEEAFRCF